MPDHVHILFGSRPSQSLSDLMQDVKGSSSKWITEKD
jgi:putative transposase